MLESVLQNHDHIKSVKLDEDSSFQTLTKDEVTLVREIIEILTPFDRATKAISGKLFLFFIIYRILFFYTVYIHTYIYIVYR